MARTLYHFEYYQRTDGAFNGPWASRTFAAYSNSAAARKVIAHAKKTGDTPFVCLNRRTGRAIALPWGEIHSILEHVPSAKVIELIPRRGPSTVELFLGREAAD